MRRKVEEKYECRFLLQVCLVCERSLTLCKWPDARCYYDYNTKHPAAQEGSQAYAHNRPLNSLNRKGILNKKFLILWVETSSKNAWFDLPQHAQHDV